LLYFGHPQIGGTVSSAEYKFNNHKILSKQEEYQLFHLYHNEKSLDRKLRIKNMLISYNMRFAGRVASAYITKYSHVDKNDLKGYAMAGLIESVDKFDHTRGIKFISFAVWWIKNHIIKSVQKYESLVRVPGNLHTSLQERITNKTTTEEDHIMMEAIKGGTSIHRPVDGGNLDDSNKTVGDTIASDDDNIIDCIDNKLIKQKLAQVISELDTKQRIVLEELFGLRSGEARAIRDVAIELNISHENVRYIRNRALSQLKSKIAHLR